MPMRHCLTLTSAERTTSMVKKAWSVKLRDRIPVAASIKKTYLTNSLEVAADVAGASSISSSTLAVDIMDIINNNSNRKRIYLRTRMLSSWIWTKSSSSIVAERSGSSSSISGTMKNQRNLRMNIVLLPRKCMVFLRSARLIAKRTRNCAKSLLYIRSPQSWYSKRTMEMMVKDIQEKLSGNP